jgi:hypothetical protein
MGKRTLSLKREALTELTGEELDRVVGASGLTCAVCLPQSDFAQCVPTHRCFDVTEAACTGTTGGTFAC